MADLPDDLPPELAGLDPEEVLAFLRTATDDEVRERVHALGTARVLPLLFAGWATRVGPSGRRSPGLLLVTLDDDGVTHRHGLVLDREGARHVADPQERARGGFATTLVRFLRVAAGAQDPKRLVLTGRLRLTGDPVWTVATLAGLKG